MIWLLSTIIALLALSHPALLCILLRPALKGLEQPRQYWYCIPATLLAWVSDALICHTTSWRLISGPLQSGEWTISQSLHRLTRTPGPRQQLFIEIAREINRQSLSGKHIDLSFLEAPSVGTP